jgi:hypothetical protein
MSTNVDFRIPTKPGAELAAVSEKLRVAASEGQFGQFPATDIAAKEGKILAAGWGGRDAYVAARYIVTLDNTATVAYATGVAGVRFQTNATSVDNDDVGATTNEARLVAPGIIFKAMARVNVSSVANLGLAFGFAGGLAVPATPEVFTAPNDGVYLIKAKNAATMVGRVIQNGAAAVDSGTLLTMTDAADAVVGVEFCLGAVGDSVGSIVAAKSYANWWINGTAVPFSAAQMTALLALINTTAPTLQGHLGFRVNGTTQRNGVANWVTWDADR